MIKNNLSIIYHNPLSSDWFEKSIDNISKYYQFISAEDLKNFYEGKIKIKNCCHITFDDGYKSVYNYAYPILKKKGIPATLFVSPTKIEQQENYWFQVIEQSSTTEVMEIAQEYFPEYKFPTLRKYDLFNLLKTTTISTLEKIAQQLKEKKNDLKPLNMSLDNLREIKLSGVFEIGAHTLNHPILSNETEEDSFFEISESIKQLESLINQEVQYFAYPNGIPNLDFSEREYQILKDNNIKLSFTTEHRFIDKSDHQFAVPRINIANGGATKILIKCLILPYFQKILMNGMPTSEKNQRKAIKNILYNQ